MCGFVGAFRPGGVIATSPEQLVLMRDAMIHRGPDGEGLWAAAAGDCALGHRRLSIIDLSPDANQPMLSADGQVAIAFNGEIYNHAELRRELQATGRYTFRTDHSDTETLLYAFMEWGEACVDRLYGMFAFAIHDSRDGARPRLHLVRDRVGVKPLYFTRMDDGEWLFASEIKALLVHPRVPRAMNDAAFWHYLTFIVAPAPMTMFEGIFKLPAATWVTIESDGQARARRFWTCQPSAEQRLRTQDLSFDEACDEVERLLRQSIARRMVSDVPFGVLLSGGVDSSLNVALMSEMMDRPVSTFTIGYEGHDQYNEFEFARAHARRYATEHHETRIDAGEAMRLLPTLVQMQDEPVADNVCIPLYFLARLVRQSGTTVVQVGEGADENFLGYWWCKHYQDKEQAIYNPALAGCTTRTPWKHFLRRLLRIDPRMVADLPADDLEIAARARAGQELFWGGAVCWWGALRERLTPTASAFNMRSECPVPGLLPEAHLEADSHAIVADYLADFKPGAGSPVLWKIPYLEHALRLPEHLLMRVDKMTMAHSVEARVPFLDHDVVEFAQRLPLAYRLEGDIGKRILKKVAEKYVDPELVYRRKQGFGAPMDEWFRNPEFGGLVRDTYRRSQIRERGYFDNAFVEGLIEGQIDGRSNYGFHLWTIMNAVFWHEHWIG